MLLVLSLKWTKQTDPYITFWGPNNGGYRWSLGDAGRYEPEDVAPALDYYHDGESAIAVPADLAEQLAITGTAKLMDGRTGTRVVENTAENRRKLCAAARRLYPPRRRIQWRWRQPR